MASNMAQRVMVAVIAIPTAAGLIMVGGWYLVAAVAVLGVLGSGEVYRLVGQTGTKPLEIVGFVGAALAPIGVYLLIRRGADAGLWILTGGVLWFLVVMVATLLKRGPTDEPLAGLAATVFGVLYTSVLLSFVLVLRHNGDLSPAPAVLLVLFPLVCTWICDSAAMAGGGMFGGPKLAPVVSPNKTWSGAISGFSAAVVVAVLWNALLLDRFGIELNLLQAATVGAAVGIFGQIGDLAESLFKRSVGVKDSGAIFPGHGGVLDRLDSLYWVIPITSLLLLWFRVP